jgi:hypothetical protein
MKVRTVMLGIFIKFPWFVSGPLTTSQYDFSVRQLFYYILPPPILPSPEFKVLAVTANEAEKNFSTAFFSQNAVVGFGPVKEFTYRPTHSVKLVMVCFEGNRALCLNTKRRRDTEEWRNTSMSSYTWQHTGVCGQLHVMAA